MAPGRAGGGEAGLSYQRTGGAVRQGRDQSEEGGWRMEKAAEMSGE